MGGFEEIKGAVLTLVSLSAECSPPPLSRSGQYFVYPFFIIINYPKRIKYVKFSTFSLFRTNPREDYWGEGLDIKPRKTLGTNFFRILGACLEGRRMICPFTACGRFSYRG